MSRAWPQYLVVAFRENTISCVTIRRQRLNSHSLHPHGEDISAVFPPLIDRNSATFSTVNPQIFRLFSTPFAHVLHLLVASIFHSLFRSFSEAFRRRRGLKTASSRDEPARCGKQAFDAARSPPRGFSADCTPPVARRYEGVSDQVRGSESDLRGHHHQIHMPPRRMVLGRGELLRVAHDQPDRVGAPDCQ